MRAAEERLRVSHEVHHVIAHTLADLGSLITVLRDDPADTEPQADLASLDALIADTRGAGLEVTLDEHGDRAVVPAITAIAVRRVVQGSLANTLKSPCAREPAASSPKRSNPPNSAGRSTHITRAIAKLNVRDRVQLVILAYESGLIRPGT
ncbi:hypothetical protein [Microbispora sp. H10885]|uniref:hypothetical protein n=1 Tax=Microbispora sp. H10885 TaxID=2729110 RepID=UPI001C720643